MTDENKALSIPTPNLPVVKMEGELTIKDILSVAVNKVENSLREKLRTSEKNAKAIDKDIKSATKDLDKASKEVQKTCGLTQELLDVSGPLRKLFPSASFGGLLKPEIELNRERNCIIFSYSIDHYKRANREIDFNAEIIELFDTLDQYRDSLSLENAEQMSLRSKLSNIPQLERRYKAKIAENQLKESKEGQAILNTLTINIDDEIANL